MMLSDQPAYAHLSAKRREQASRLAQLRHRIDRMDARHNPNALIALQQVAANVASQLEEIDNQLAAPSVAEADASRLRVHVARFPHDGEAMTVREAKAAARSRLYLVLQVLSHVPAGCDEAAALLRQGINRELRLLDELKAVERRTKKGSAP